MHLLIREDLTGKKNTVTKIVVDCLLFSLRVEYSNLEGSGVLQCETNLEDS